jgi:predicted ATP-grasp superfamily ATP-dependent carboligase
MRLVIYEWCCSGGLSEAGSADAVGFVEEGRAMFEALATDAVRDGRFDVVAMVDESQSLDLPAEIVVRPVAAGAEIAALTAEAARADVTLVVAPETDGLLADRVARVRAAGGRPLACDAPFLELAADKQATVLALAAAGVPVAAGRSLAAGDPWPEGFHRPAVAKARRSAGCDGLVFIGEGGRPAAATTPLRIEAFVPGMPVGVSCLCGPAGVSCLPALRQVFSTAPAVRSLGSEPVADVPLRRRAERLAARAVAAVTRASGGVARGWVGVDMILGDRGDGSSDRVLEVNPRITTSFVMHARGRTASLVGAALDIATGMHGTNEDVTPDAITSGVA